MTPREFCQEQLRMLGDEELLPDAQAASLEILHTTIMNDPSPDKFEARLRSLARDGASAQRSQALAAQVARVLLEAWLDSRG
jgi:hypothetical protein